MKKSELRELIRECISQINIKNKPKQKLIKQNKEQQPEIIRTTVDEFFR